MGSSQAAATPPPCAKYPHPLTGMIATLATLIVPSGPHEPLHPGSLPWHPDKPKSVGDASGVFPSV